MVNTRPHILKWVAVGGGQPEADPLTGFPIPGTLGEARSVPCRFHLDNTREFKNEDNTVTRQVGTIRLDAGSDLPALGQQIEVVGHFKGEVRDIYRGQLSYRIDV